MWMLHVVFLSRSHFVLSFKVNISYQISSSGDLEDLCQKKGKKAPEQQYKSEQKCNSLEESTFL